MHSIYSLHIIFILISFDMIRSSNRFFLFVGHVLKLAKTSSAVEMRPFSALVVLLTLLDRESNPEVNLTLKTITFSWIQTKKIIYVSWIRGAVLSLVNDHVPSGSNPEQILRNKKQVVFISTGGHSVWYWASPFNPFSLFANR